ncbi:MAG: Re/Si-specific NAD(P)(+) transhydrogenase subunit alpha [Planctomycetaceae bacterium]
MSENGTATTFTKRAWRRTITTTPAETIPLIRTRPDVAVPIAGVPIETSPGERRVALVPAAAANLVKKGVEVIVEAGAGVRAGFPDRLYIHQGAKVVASRAEVFESAKIILQVRAAAANPDGSKADLELFRDGQLLIALCDPLIDPQAMLALARRNVSAFALELVPRITRAQSMDVLSSMATIAGYKAVLLAADHLPRMFPMLMTAAGTITPARVFVVGAGVAGLQAISTAKRLGAVVQAYDVRPAAKEQVESLGGKFVEMELDTAHTEQKGGYARQMDENFYRKQRELMTKVVAANHVVITTAVVPGKQAPVLITGDMVAGMAPGSVIVDLAAERGGNCELTNPGQTVVEHGVTILGPLNVPASIPFHASEMYSRNISSFLLHLIEDRKLQLDLDDEIIRETLVTYRGEVVQPVVRELLGLNAAPQPQSTQPSLTERPS